MQKAFAKKISKKLQPEKEKTSEGAMKLEGKAFIFFLLCFLPLFLFFHLCILVPSVVRNILLTFVLTFICWLYCIILKANK